MDLDADGNFDILSGSYSRNEQPMAGLFQVLWGRPDGTFKKAAVLNGADEKPLIIPAAEGQQGYVECICTRPTAVDWDGDGDLDLVSGNFSGKFYLFTGEGKGKFQPKAEPIKVGDTPLQISGAHGDPFFVDWDGDGDLDMLSGTSQGGVMWAENTAGAKKVPVFKAFAALIPVPKEPVYECKPDAVKEPSSGTRVWAADVNGDKKLDILVGDTISLVSPASGVSEADFLSRRAEWDKTIAATYQEMQNQADEKKMNELNERVTKLYEQRKEFMIEDRTGFVWVYVQK